MSWIGVFHRECDQRMASLMKGDTAFLVARHYPSFLLQAELKSIDGLLEVHGTDFGVATANRCQGRFIHHVGEIGADHARRALRDDPSRTAVTNSV
jgi:hypothetical protein